LCVAPRGVEAAAHLVGLADLTARSLLARDLGGDGEKRGDLVKHDDGRNMSLEANGRSTLVLGGARSFLMVLETTRYVTLKEPYRCSTRALWSPVCVLAEAPRNRVDALALLSEAHPFERIACDILIPNCAILVESSIAFLVV